MFGMRRTDDPKWILLQVRELRKYKWVQLDFNPASIAGAPFNWLGDNRLRADCVIDEWLQEPYTESVFSCRTYYLT
jgi:hypothetical protein